MAHTRPIKWGTPSSFVCTGIMFVFAVLAFIAGIHAMNQRNKGRDECTEKVTATVVRYAESKRQPVNSKHSAYTVYMAVYQYEYNGWTYYGMESPAESKQFEIGQKVELMLDPNDPDNFYVPSERATAGPMIICLAISLISLITAFGMLWLSLAASGKFDHGEGGWKDK